MRINTRKRRGGYPIPGTSAANYVMNNYGNQNEQVSRVNNNYSDIVASKSNFLTPSWAPMLGSKGVIHNLFTGGKSKKKRLTKNRHTKKKGGFFYEVIKQAVVPFTLLAMNTSFKNKKRPKKRPIYKKIK